MSKDENKRNLADVLEEYFPGAGQKAEQVLNEMFADYAFPEETAEAEQTLEVPENGSAESVPVEEAAEIISLEVGEDFDDSEEVPDEPFEVPEEAEETEPEKTEELSTLSEWAEWAEEAIAANAAASETFGAADEENVPEEQETTSETEDTETVEDEQETADEEDVSKEEPAESSESEKITEDEDINEKWLSRFAKGIFPVKGDGVFEVIRKIIFLAAVTVFVGAGIMLASTLIQSQKAQEIQSSMREIIETTLETYIDEEGNVQTVPLTKEEEEQHRKEVAEIFKAINEDYVGYVTVEGCDIYEPVVKGNDNKYYLKNNIYGEQNKAGTIFMDYRCTVTSEYTSPNLVLYGHNQEDGTMFGRLKYYKVDYTQEDPNADFYKNNPVIKFNSEFENGDYLIYAFFVTNALESQDSNGEVFHYHDYIETLNDEYTFNWYQGEVQKRNQIISPVDVRYGDKLLVLSTCSNEFSDSRFVVFARKLREGESVSDYDFSEARRNPDAKGVDWKAILSGETSETTVTEAEEEEILDDFTTHVKSLNKRNEKTYTTASEEEDVTEAPVTTTAATAEAAAVTTVPESVTSRTETETAGSTDSSETDVTETDESDTDVQTDENGVPAAETDENGETVTYSETETSESDTETTTKKKKKAAETSESSEVVTSKKKSNKSNK